MCFSVGASFTASGVLTIIGGLSLLRAPKKYRLFAAIPLLFAAQQFAEGIVWMVLNNPLMHIGAFKKLLFFPVAPAGLLVNKFQIPEYILFIKSGAIFTFLFFAFVIWPFWIPLACRRFEEHKKRKQLLSALLALGTLISITLLYTLLTQSITAAVIKGHIVYTVPHIAPFVSSIGILLYTIAAMGPFFVSSLPYAPFLGGIIVASEVLAWYFWHTAFVSTWCFFAAILSIMVVALLPSKKTA